MSDMVIRPSGHKYKSLKYKLIIKNVKKFVQGKQSIFGGRSLKPSFTLKEFNFAGRVKYLCIGEHKDEVC